MRDQLCTERHLHDQKVLGLLGAVGIIGMMLFADKARIKRLMSPPSFAPLAYLLLEADDVLCPSGKFTSRNSPAPDCLCGVMAIVFSPTMAKCLSAALQRCCNSSRSGRTAVWLTRHPATFLCSQASAARVCRPRL
ncbi:MAG: hypothetical protein ACLRIO_04065 [Butyricicoccus sp.]